ncbi:rho GTPase-activating protein 27 isoform X3 [Zootoca vivipara]|uniref:rho GTPase-activating protein 27 isoform X3 n=1 Tax=Zootoca vivipara TaxID=8524 RepID=UPI00293BDD01|nr:rho GTPase-activating protein 27 isoform X3 [Zootoca vivipara]
MDSLGGKEERYVLVEYPFEYTAKDGQLISIQPNERYMLLRRTNDHWWHVRKNKEARPFYIPAKYVKELGPVTHTMPPSEELPPTTMLENANLETSIGVSQEPAAEYEYRFVSAVPVCEVDAEKAAFPSLRCSISSGVETTIPFDVGGKAPSPISGASRAALSALSASHGSLQPRDATGSDSSPVGYSHSSEHIRSTVSLDDLAKFATPPGQAGVGNLHKAASWSPAHPLPKSNSETFHKATQEKVEEHTPEPCARQPQPSKEVAEDPVYVNLQELRLERSPSTASKTESIPQPHLSSPPASWETHTDAESGRLFYYNSATGQTTWELPIDGPACGGSPPPSCSPLLALSPATPAEWDQYVDEASGQVFFYNTSTGETSWDAPQRDETLNYPEMQPAFVPYSPVDRRPPTPETDYPNFSPDELEPYPEEDYSPVGSYQPLDGLCVPSAYQGWPSYGNQEGLVFDGDQYASNPVTPSGHHHHSTSSGSSLDSSPFGNWSTFSGPKEGQLKTLEKAGMLFRTKTADKGKRQRKNWSSSWTVLEGGVLTFFKDSKHSTSSSVKHPSVLSSPEHTVDLSGATLSWAAKDKSSKKNVLELKTREGSEYLIRHDSECIISTWQKAIADSISKLPTDFPPEDNEENSSDLRSKEQLGSNREKEGEKKSPASWHSSTSLNSDSDSSKVRNKLLRFLQRRPTLQSLRERGYIKDQVFGCPLQVLCDREKSTVPQFVRQCICTVEKRGLDIDGLYRISGNLATIQKLRYKVDHDERLDLDDGRWDDVHVITGALKLFFRELPEPLFPFSHFDRFIAAIKITEPSKRSYRLRELVNSLPPANHNTMRVLFQHLCRVIEFREENRMSVQSVAIVFGPTLLKPEAEEGNMTMYMVFQNQIVEQILSQYSYIFPES